MIPVSRAHLYVAASTHTGMRRKNNEDRYAVSAYQLSQSYPLPALLALVADGIGGHRGGEVASEMAVELISQSIASCDGTRPIEQLRSAILQASQAIYERSLLNPELNGMGTTCAACWIIGDRLFIASVGDSRIYLVRAKKSAQSTITQLSTDHTWIQEAVDNGYLTADQAAGHINTHVIRRFLGSRTPVEPDMRLRLYPNESNAQAEANQGLQLKPQDTLLLCSDGLTDLVKANEILRIVQIHPLSEATELLTALANQRGGHDNITVVALQAPKGSLQGPSGKP